MPSGIPPAAIGAAIADELPKIFDDAVNRARDGGPSTIQSGNPQSIPGRIGQATARAACRRYGTGELNLSESDNEKFERSCRPYLDDQDPGKGAGIGIPFEGGQCPSVYNVDIETWQVGGGYATVGVRSVTGPIQSLSVVQISAFNFLMTVTGAPPSVDTTTQGSLFGNPPRWGAISLAGGGPDNCGDPQPVVTQPRPIADPNPPPFRFNPNGDINVNVGVDVLPDGTINVNVGGPTFNVDPFPPDPTGPGGGGGGGGNDPVGGPGTAGNSDDTGISTVAEGSADEGEELVGVLVQILAAPTDANRFFNNSELVYRGAYYVAMGYPGRLGLDMSGGTAETLQFFHAQQRGLTDYRVRANLGFNLRVTPYYRTLEP